MAAVSDATTAVGSSQNWFKVAEIGMPSNNPVYWGTQVLNVCHSLITKIARFDFTFALGQLWPLYIHCS